MIAHRSSPDELYEEGKRLRDKCPRQSHAVWRTPTNRPDPVLLLEQSSKGRIPQLIPVRYGRMMQTPFTFYRGAALNMAADLAATPTTGLRVQACGDCHFAGQPRNHRIGVVLRFPRQMADVDHVGRLEGQDQVGTTARKPIQPMR